MATEILLKIACEGVYKGFSPGTLVALLKVNERESVKNTTLKISILVSSLSLLLVACGEQGSSVPVVPYGATGGISGRWVLDSVDGQSVAIQNSATMEIQYAETSGQSIGVVVAILQEDGSLKLGESHPAYSVSEAAENFKAVQLAVQASPTPEHVDGKLRIQNLEFVPELN